MISSFLARSRLRAGEKALRKAQLDRAEKAFVAAFASLQKLSVRRRSELPSLARALVGIIETHQQRGTPAAAVEYCRTARRRGIDHPEAYALPCREALASGELTAAQTDDLVVWACRCASGAGGDISTDAVSQRLKRQLLSPPHQQPDATRQTHLHQLDDAQLPWSWVPLYIAEDARLAGDWSEAVGRLAEAARWETDAARRADLRWRRVHCLLHAQERRAAADEYGVLLAECLPATAPQWRIALRAIAEDDGRGESMPWVKAAVRAFPHDEVIWRLAQYIAYRTQQWRALAELTAQREAPNRPIAERIADVRVRCEAALRLKDAGLARDCVEQIESIGMARPPMPDELREFAAVQSTTNPARCARIFAEAAASAHTAAAKKRLYIATVWLVCAGRKCPWSQQLAADLKQSRERIVQGPQWAGLAWLSNCHLLIKQKKYSAFLEFMSKGIASHRELPPDQLRWLLAMGAKLAADASDARRLLLCANQTDDIQTRRWAGEHLKHLALGNCGELAHKSQEQLQTILAQWRAAAKLGASMTDAQATAACVLALALGEAPSHGAAPVLPPTIPKEPKGFAVAWMAARWGSGAPHWWETPAGMPSPRRTGRLGKWLAGAMGVEFARAGKWSDAARVLDIRDAAPDAILQSLGLPDADIHSARAWAAFERGQFNECIGHCLQELKSPHAHNGRALPLAVNALLSGGFFDRRQDARLNEVAQVLKSTPQNGSPLGLPWFVCARLGLLEQACALLDRQIQQGTIRAEKLHAYALMQLSLAEQKRIAAAGPAAQCHLACAMGAWASFLETQRQTLGDFAIGRYRQYGHGQEVPAAKQTSHLVDECINRMVGRYADEETGAARRVRLMWELEKAAAAVAARHGGLPREQGAVVAGPLLAVALGIRGAHEALATRLESSSHAGQGPLDGLQLLAALLGHELGEFAPLSAGKNMAQDAVELRRLFSPLGPAHVLMGQQRYGDARSELELLGDDPQSKAAGGDYWMKLLSSHAALNRASGWLQGELRQMLIECDLQASRQVVGHVPIESELTRQTWQRALDLGRRINQLQQVQDCIGEIAVGRAQSLIAKRTKEQRLADGEDRRGNSERRKEAIALLELAWELTKSRKLEGPLHGQLNQMGLEAWEAKSRDEALLLFLRALSVKPTSSVACTNYRGATLVRFQEAFETDRQAAGECFLADRRRLAEIDPHRQSKEIQECLAGMDEQAPVPYFNLSNEALEREDWDLATELVIWCLRLNSVNAHVQDRTRTLAGRLQREAEGGNRHCGQLLSRLREHMPPGFQEAAALHDLPDDFHRLLLAAMQGRLPLELTPQQQSPQDRAMELNTQAVQAARAERFAQAMQLLAEAHRLAPQLEIVQDNIRNIGLAWSDMALKRGNISESLHALSVAQQILGLA